jgi:hypothetical protein
MPIGDLSRLTVQRRGSDAAAPAPAEGVSGQEVRVRGGREGDARDGRVHAAPPPAQEAQGVRPPRQPQGQGQGRRRHRPLRHKDGTYAENHTWSTCQIPESKIFESFLEGKALFENI